MHSIIQKSSQIFHEFFSFGFLNIEENGELYSKADENQEERQGSLFDNSDL